MRGRRKLLFLYGLLLEQKVAVRRQKRFERGTRTARPPYVAMIIDNVHCHAVRSLKPASSSRLNHATGSASLLVWAGWRAL
jgi:hypothetical protein